MGPKRAKRGSIDGAVLVRMSAELREAVDAAAEDAEVSVAEWLREAAARMLRARRAKGTVKR
jgi:predicted HicB family RNase H-like nuclease